VSITSGSGDRDRLDQWLVELGNNVYGRLDRSVPLADLAAVLLGAGWSVRKASWETYEATVPWCSFVLADLGDNLNLSGVVDPTRLDELADAVSALGIDCSLELYDQELRLTRTVTRTAGGPG
jgi:hypothetical protein